VQEKKFIHIMAIISPSLLLLLSCIVTVLMEPTTTSAFSVMPSSSRRISIATINNDNVPLLQLTMASTRNYGPRDDQLPPSSKDATERSRLKSDFIKLIDTIINGTTPEHEFPSLFTQNIDTIMRVIGYNSNSNSVGARGGGGGSLLQEIMQDELLQSNENDGNSQNRVDQISDAIDLILTFVESFVEQTKTMDDVYKQLLGKIFQSIAPGASESSSGITPSLSSSSSANMENQLDNLLSTEKEAFTPGFLRHVEGECLRIASLSTISPESAKMLQILRLIQTRVLEELGKVSRYIYSQ